MGDCWLVDYHLESVFNDRDTIEKCKHIFKDFVSNYWKDGSWVNSVDINHDLWLIQNSLKYACNNLNCEDTLVWGIHPIRRYKVATFFKAKVNDIPPPWVKAWMKGLVSKIKIFFWISL